MYSGRDLNDSPSAASRTVKPNCGRSPPWISLWHRPYLRPTPPPRDRSHHQQSGALRAVSQGDSSVVAAVGVIVVGVALGLSVATPTQAHSQTRLSAKILGVHVSCFESGRICVAEGRVRVFNRRAPGTQCNRHLCRNRRSHSGPPKHLARTPVARGLGGYQASPRDVSREHLQDGVHRAAGKAHHVHVTHVHKHIVHGFGGAQC
jgi:hypothetical protein